MRCDRCQRAQATVHISTILHYAPSRDEHHFCADCAEVVQTSSPSLNPGGEPLVTLGSKVVTSFSPEVKARIKAANDKLSDLDPILQGFCKRRAYILQVIDGLEPQRTAWARDELYRCLWLSTDSRPPEILNRGFYPEMPWSLCAYGSSLFTPSRPRRVLTLDLFRRIPFSGLARLLDQRLEEGFAFLRELTLEGVLAKGQVVQ